jgi:phosphatidylserine/phosphatidylglycerophosphate/cardiolipin synthase-like enzyme
MLSFRRVPQCVLTVVLLFAVQSTSAETRVYFSPRGGCQKAILDSISQAQSEVLVAAYSLTSKPIAEALLDAARRGVSVHLVVDRRQPGQNSSRVRALAEAGVPTKVDRSVSLMHMKLIIVDRRRVICGSYNYSAAAETRNAEILLVIDDPDLARKCVRAWQDRYASSSYLGTPPPDTKPPAVEPDPIIRSTDSGQCRGPRCRTRPRLRPLFRQK